MIQLTDENFDEVIQNAQKPVLVDFFAAWCPPCSTLSPILERLEKEFEEKVIFAKVNVDDSPKTSQKFGINPIPAVFLLKEGKAVSEFVGAKPEFVIKEWLENLLKDGEAESLIREYEEYAEKNGFRLNPNKKIVEGIVKSLLEREKKLGSRFCPCRRVTGDKEGDQKLICPCFWHQEEIEKDGRCFCGLFVKK